MEAGNYSQSLAVTMMHLLLDLKMICSPPKIFTARAVRRTAVLTASDVEILFHAPETDSCAVSLCNHSPFSRFIPLAVTESITFCMPRGDAYKRLRLVEQIYAQGTEVRVRAALP